MHEECGIAAVITDNCPVKEYLYYSLFALQHRGQEAYGIVCCDGQQLSIHKHHGLVADSFNLADQRLQGHLGIGHVRYSTHGGAGYENIQPFYQEIDGLGLVALAHNGNITNNTILRRELEAEGVSFQSTTDSEIFIHLLARSRGDLRQRLRALKDRVYGAYALAVINDNRIYGIRDPYGFRPLVIGRKDELWMLASESCALDLIEAQLIREVKAGEIVSLDFSTGLTSHGVLAERHEARCSFEAVYFSRPDSIIDGREVYSLRKELGKRLAVEETVGDADLVIAVPDSGVPMALGYSEYRGIPSSIGLIRNHYVGRSFIQPRQGDRDLAVRLKLNPLPHSLQGKNLIVVDDSLVRGTTAKKIIALLRDRGVAQIHLRIGSPPITHSCFYGVDTPKRDDLLAARHDCEQIRKILGVDSLRYLSIEALHEVLGQGNCDACFSGYYREKIFSGGSTTS